LFFFIRTEIVLSLVGGGIIKGGSFTENEYSVISFSRNEVAPEARYTNCGFRIVGRVKRTISPTQSDENN